MAEVQIIQLPQAHSNFHCDCDHLTSPSYDASLFTSVFIVTSTPPAAAGIQEFFLRRSSLPAFRHILSVKSSSPSADRPVKVCRLFVPVPCLAALCLASSSALLISSNAPASRTSKPRRREPQQKHQYHQASFPSKNLQTAAVTIGRSSSDNRIGIKTHEPCP